ncbi:hypothetical protein UFOVP322_1 [uncultured Caudovirales phage]|uniref:Uncharacterized protein n=1 Tax=uncultured Caudovirales phage TaxID=2100421 RepID=A0A6J5LR86_9CAUD|nr:hypothetical protein UFOVP322_1 [uncultured Caudovirales phage]CAB4161190.1 hypothetical protein UFOVP771_39 [uncultured Caudovirales phage]CAB4166582.1 hypothetical protein UFOVP850_39 [uncultured Caudovirales phage]
MPLGSFRLNSIAKVLSTQPVETTYSPGWYSYTTDSGENNTSWVSNHQIAIMGYNSDYTIRGVAAIQPKTDTNNYLLPFKWNYSTNTWTIGTKVVTQAAPTDYTGFTGRKAVSELYPTSAGVVDATNYGAHYIPGNIAADRKIIPYTMDASGNLTILTGTATGSPSIGTSQDSGDLVYVAAPSGTPTYAFFTREDAGNNTIAVYTRSGDTITKIPGINSFGSGNRSTVEGASTFPSTYKACFIVINQNGQVAAVTVDNSNVYSISTTATTNLIGKVTAVNISTPSTGVSRFALCGTNTESTYWATQVITVTWGAPSTITQGAVSIFESLSNTPDLGYQQNMRIEKGWNDDEVMLFYIRNGVVYGRYAKMNSLLRMCYNTEQTFSAMTNARSLDVQPVYIDATHRYFLGMINNSAGENVDGDMNLFAVRAQEIALPSQMYNIRLITTSVNEGSGITIAVDTIGVADGTTLYWTIQTNASDFATTSGSFTISSGGIGTIVATPTADTTTEGAETFTVAVRTGSTAGTIVATSLPITINDTSLTQPSLTFVASAFQSSTSNATITIPATAQAGDIAILFDRQNSTSSTQVTPSGWTQITTALSAAATPNQLRITISYRILTAGQPGTSVTGQGTTARKTMVVYRPSSPITTATLLTNSSSVSANSTAAASNISTNLTAQTLRPILAYSFYAQTVATTFTRTSTLAAEREITDGGNFTWVRMFVFNPGSSTSTINTHTMGTSSAGSIKYHFEGSLRLS